MHFPDTLEGIEQFCECEGQPSSALQELICAAMALLDAWESFNDPKVRVGPVYPRMRDLASVLGRKTRA